MVRPGTGHWPLQRPVNSTEQLEGQMHSVGILPYQSGKRSAPAFQIGAAQDQQTKSAEPVRWRISAVESHSTEFCTEVVNSHCSTYHICKDTVNSVNDKFTVYYV